MQLVSIQSRAVGFIAIGAEAHGVFALGQVAYGVVAVGQMATGMIAIGQLARGWIAIGQGAIGIYALGQGAVGLLSATGMLAIAAKARGLALSVWPKTELAHQPKFTPFADLLSGREDRGWVQFSTVRNNGVVRFKIEGQVRDDIAVPPDTEAQTLIHNKRSGWVQLVRESSTQTPENANFRSPLEHKSQLIAAQVQWKYVTEVSSGRWIVTAVVMAILVTFVSVVSLVPALKGVYSAYDEDYQPE